MTDTGTVLREKEAKLEARAKKARVTLEAVETELADVRTALKVLVGLGLAEAPTGIAVEGPTGQEALSESQTAVIAMVPKGKDHAAAPKHIIDLINLMGPQLNGDYVRTVLWRAAKRGIIYNEGGLYWRDKEEAPGSPPEASDNLGPATGREGGYPPSTPEGSIPSGSTPSQAVEVAPWEDDDDIPF